jgi:hypothetical protein
MTAKRMTSTAAAHHAALDGARVRYAIYYAPEVGSPLDAFGRSWLGSSPLREAMGNENYGWPEIAGLTPDEIRAVLSQVAHYGFHGTLKAPFFLYAPDLAPALIDAVRSFAASQRPFRLPPLQLTPMHRFLALMPASASSELGALAEACVCHFDPYRRPASAAELVRRRATGLTPRQEQHLVRWGYPYVLDEFRFHLTLAGPVSEERVMAKLIQSLGERLAALDLEAVVVRSICLFVQEGQERPFYCHSRYAFTDAND